MPTTKEILFRARKCFMLGIYNNTDTNYIETFIFQI